MTKKLPLDPVERLLEIMTRLRSPDGCPWDRLQTPDTLKPYLLEETYEVLAALQSDAPLEVRGELGDLLLQIVFLSELFRESGAFDFNDVAASICEKLVRRHPHVFGGSNERDLAALDRQWEEIKRTEKKSRPKSMLGHIPGNLPALLLAQKISDRVAGAGFDWENHRQVIQKLEEEMDELKEAIAGGDAGEIGDELGDILFTVVNIGRHLDVDCETALLKMTHRFRARFELLESLLENDGRNLLEMTPAEMEPYWQKAKSLLNKKTKAT